MGCGIFTGNISVESRRDEPCGSVKMMRRPEIIAAINMFGFTCNAAETGQQCDPIHCSRRTA
jgi:hypothetical protein